MAEQVEVVIKIPKYYLTHPQDYTCLAECVRRGTPLPKGYGKYDELKEAIQKIKDEIQEKINQEIYSDGTPSEYAYCYDSVLDIIDKHLKEVDNG